MSEVEVATGVGVGNPIGGECHCGGVRFSVRLIDGLETAQRCNCSYCAKRGAVAVTANLADLEILEGEDLLSRYEFNTHTAKHYFCSRCGIHTFHQRRSNPEEYAVNVACLDGVSPFDFRKVPVTEGRVHANDRDGGRLVAGVLKYEPEA